MKYGGRRAEKEISAGWYNVQGIKETNYILKNGENEKLTK
jgi:hypothetical protein